MHRQLARLGFALILVLVSHGTARGNAPPPAADDISASARLSITPSSAIVLPGDSFTFDVVLDMQPDSHAVSSAVLKVNYDPAVLRAIEFAPNTAQLPQLVTLEELLLDPGTGSAGLVLGIGSSSLQAIRDSARLATITFVATGSSGSSSLITWDKAEALSVSSGDQMNQNVIGLARGARICLALDPCELAASDVYLPLVMADR